MLRILTPEEAAAEDAAAAADLEKKRDPAPMWARVVLGCSVAQVAKWAEVKRKEVDRYELDQADPTGRLADIYAALIRLREVVEGARKKIAPTGTPSP